MKKKVLATLLAGLMALSLAAIRELNEYRSRHPFLGGWLFLREKC